MTLHRNARTCPASRALIARRVIDDDWTLAVENEGPHQGRDQGVHGRDVPTRRAAFVLSHSTKDRQVI
jgi:hypothetical protein